MERRTSPLKRRRSIAEWTLYIDELKQLIDHYMALGLPLDADRLHRFLAKPLQNAIEERFEVPNKAYPVWISVNHVHWPC